MPHSSHQQEKETSQQFQAEADTSQQGFLSELLAWLRHTKKWWLAPIIAVLLIAGLLVVVSGTAIAPLIYTLF